MESALAMSAGFDRDALVEQHRNLVFQLVLGLGIGNGNPRPFGLKKKCGRHPRSAEANHQDAFAVYVHKVLFHHRDTEPQRKQANCNKLNAHG
jgi:hypothetical protein